MNAVPKYIEIMNDIESQIKSNKLKAGDQIPTEKQLCIDYQTSRMTVNKAIMMLCEKKLIERIAGKGSFVKDYKTIKNLKLGSSGSFTQDMISTGKKPGTILIEYKLVRGKDAPEAMQALQLQENDFIHYFVRVRTGDDIPIAISYTYLSPKIFPSIDIRILESSLYDYVSSQGHTILGIDGEYSAVLPTDEQKQLLNIDQVALFKSKHTTYLSTGEPFEFISTYYVGDTYTYTLKTF